MYLLHCCSEYKFNINLVTAKSMNFIVRNAYIPFICRTSMYFTNKIDKLLLEFEEKL